MVSGEWYPPRSSRGTNSCITPIPVLPRFMYYPDSHHRLPAPCHERFVGRGTSRFIISKEEVNLFRWLPITQDEFWGSGMCLEYSAGDLPPSPPSLNDVGLPEFHRLYCSWEPCSHTYFVRSEFGGTSIWHDKNIPVVPRPQNIKLRRTTDYRGNFDHKAFSS